MRCRTVSAPTGLARFTSGRRGIGSRFSNGDQRELDESHECHTGDIEKLALWIQAVGASWWPWVGTLRRFCLPGCRNPFCSAGSAPPRSQPCGLHHNFTLLCLTLQRNASERVAAFGVAPNHTPSESAI